MILLVYQTIKYFSSRSSKTSIDFCILVESLRITSFSSFIIHIAYIILKIIYKKVVELINIFELSNDD
jgi:hypothetical protein